MQCRKAYYREEEGIFVPWKNIGLMYIKSRAPRILFPIVLNIKNFRNMQSKSQIDSSIDISNRKTNNCVCLSSVETTFGGKGACHGKSWMSFGMCYALKYVRTRELKATSVCDQPSNAEPWELGLNGHFREGFLLFHFWFFFRFGSTVNGIYQFIKK